MSKYVDKLTGGWVTPPMPKGGKRLTGIQAEEASERGQNKAETTKEDENLKGDHNEEGNR